MSENVVEVKCALDATPERVFQAWTQPEQLKQWWCTPGHSFRKVEMDVRPGGNYFYDVLGPDGSPACTVEGEFLEVTAPRKLVYSWTMKAFGITEANTVVTILLEANGERTDLTLTHQGFSSKEMFDLHNLDWPIVVANLPVMLRNPVSVQ